MKSTQRFLSLALLILSAPSVFSANEHRNYREERQKAARIRRASGSMQLYIPDYDITTEHNGDEDLFRYNSSYPYAGAQTKGFEHDATTGGLTSNGKIAFEQLLYAMTTGRQSDFNAIQFASGNLRTLINPQASFAYNFEGADSAMLSMPISPSITSPQAAVELLEVYLKSLCRDVLFEEYGTGTGSDDDGNGGSITLKAVTVLNDLLSYFTGPTNGGVVDATVLFRGTGNGPLVGPYVSQFFLHPINLLFPAGCAGFIGSLIGIENIDNNIVSHKQLIPVPSTREFIVGWDQFIALQNGQLPQQYLSTDYQATKRYPINGRDLGGYVHSDYPQSPYYTAIAILAYNGARLSPSCPYQNGNITKEGAGITLGVPEIFAMVGQVANDALKHAWAHKWRGNRKVRPEGFAGYVHRAKVTSQNPLGLDPLLFATHGGIDVLELVADRNELQAAYPENNLTSQEARTYLLPQMYPEGSPTHPTYPSGHATIAGACTTVLKAIFDDTMLFKDLAVQPSKVDPTDPTQLVLLTSGEGKDDMTIGSELDKYASNIALARNFVGIHYRADGDYGIELGEQVAIYFLRDQARLYAEEGFTGFTLTKRDGQRIRITADDVINI